MYFPVQRWLAMTKLAALFLVTLTLLPSWPVLAEEAGSMEYKVKAAYLYNFTKFITWPEKATPYFNICIVGEDPFGPLINTLENKTALDKPIRVLYLTPGKPLKDCHIAYVDSPANATTTNTRGLLIVGSLTPDTASSFFAHGGMIGFSLEDDKVKLRISLKGLKQAELNISAKLIEVSTLVDGGTP